MADEPSRNGNAKPSDTSKPRIEPDQPTPNRDKRRQPVTIDLKAETPKPATPDPAKSPTGEAGKKADSPKSDAKSGSIASAPVKPAEPVSGVPKSEPAKTEIKPAGGSPVAGSSATGAGSKVSEPTAATAKVEPAKPAVSAPLGASSTGPDTTKFAAAAKPAAAAGPPPPSRRMIVPVAASIVCAALVALGVAYAYQTYTGQDETIQAMKTQLAILQGRLDAVDKQVATVPQAAALTAMEGGIDKKFAAVDAARAQSTEASEQRLRKLESIRNEVTGALEKRVGGLEALTTTLGAQIDQANTKAEVVRIQAARAIEAVAKASATPPGAPIVLPPTIDVAPIKAKLEQVEAQLKAVETTLAKPKTEARATEVRAVVAPPKTDPANLAIVAQAVARAFDQGAPYASELAALETLGAGEKAAALKPFAEHGAPKPADLAAQFTALKPAILASVAPPPTGYLDRLARSASGLVDLEPASAPGDNGTTPSGATTPAALVGQVETAIGRGDTAAALAAWAKLPPPAQKVSQAWADLVRARDAARQAAAGLATDSLAALAKPKS